MTAAPVKPVGVYLEIGSKRVFASALDWPGWCRAGRDEQSALERLLEYGPRYGAAVASVAPDFDPPTSPRAFHGVERLSGDATTDFGAPGAIADGDWQPLTADELERLERLLQACWLAFEEAARTADGRPLATGSRGGGRSLTKMREHVLDADRAYANQVGGPDPRGTTVATWPDAQQRLLDVVRARTRGELPDRGPRGGLRWPARYTIRRSAWHALDHAWEIEDRSSEDQQ